MRITVTSIDLSPDELGPQVYEFVNAIQRQEADGTSATVVDRSEALPEDVVRHITTRARTTISAEQARRFVAEGLKLPGVEAAVSTSRSTDDGMGRHVMLHRVPRRWGAIARINPRNAKASFRLTDRDVADRDLAVAHRNNARADALYQIVCPVNTEEGLAEALDLLRVAYEKAGDGPAADGVTV